MLIDGKPLIAAYSETLTYGMHKRNRQMAAAGCETFMLIVRGGYEKDYHTTWFWRDDGVYGDESDRTDDATLDRQVAEILAAAPDARLMVRWGSEVPLRWSAQHPDELQASETTRRRESSYASRLALDGRAEMARRIVRYCEARPWGRRVIGYMAFGQDEGTTNLGIEDALFDQAPAMRREFRAYLREAYTDDAALRAAWGDATVTRAGAPLPTDTQWLADRQRWPHWPDPRALRRYQDYFAVMRRMLILQRHTELAAIKAAASWPVLAATDALKQPMFGWLIRDAFKAEAQGMAYRNILLASGSIGVGELLDDPALDGLITPADYTARSVGFGWEPEGIGDSLVLRGKTIFVEDDARSWATNERITQGAWRNVAECRAGLMRNLALAASRGHFPYWMNVGGGYFDDPEVLKEVAAQIPTRRRVLSRPYQPTEHVLALLIDDESPLDENFTSGFQQLAIVRQRNDQLSLTGLPWRIFLLSDLARDDFPVCRAYLLPNLFRLTPAKEALIRAKLFRAGSVTICGPGTAISDGKELGAAGASRLLGFPLELVPRESARRVLVHAGTHLALAGVNGPEVYGDSFAYGPMLLPAADLAASGAVELGKASAWWECNRAGLVLKEFGRGAAGNGQPGPRGPDDYAVAFSMAVPVSAAVLRALARYAGCTAWSDLGDVVGASGNLVAVHSARPGPRTVRLPQPYRVTDAVSGIVLAPTATQFDLTLAAPDTRVFLLDSPTK